MIKERRIRLTTINNKRMNLQQPPQIRVGSEIYILTPMKKLRAGDVFYVKRRLVSKDDRGAVKGRYTYKEGAIKESLDGALLWNCNIKTECGKRFNYNHMVHGAGSYNYDFYKLDCRDEEEECKRLGKE